MNVPPQPTRGRRNRRLRRGLAATAVFLVLWLTVSWAVAYRLTRRPRRWFAEPAPTVAWGTIAAHRLETRDGHTLGAWLVRGRDGAPSVLLVHGNGGSRWNTLGTAEMLAERGCTVLMISARAHGDSTGDFNDIGYGARHDVVAGMQFLERLRPGRPIVVHGTSMGAAAALFASKELGDRVRGYILESPYRDLRTAVWNRINNALPPLLDAMVYRGLMAVAPMVLSDLDRIAPVGAIAEVPGDVPVLILAGDRDRLARPEEAQELFERVKTHGTLLIFPGSDHLQMRLVDPARYRDAVLGLIDRVCRQRD
jgi:alpha-beta hydrolase superfamily lysophospholipase